MQLLVSTYQRFTCNYYSSKGHLFISHPLTTGKYALQICWLLNLCSCPIRCWSYYIILTPSPSIANTLLSFQLTKYYTAWINCAFALFSMFCYWDEFLVQWKQKHEAVFSILFGSPKIFRITHFCIYISSCLYFLH